MKNAGVNTGALIAAMTTMAQTSLITSTGTTARVYEKHDPSYKFKKIKKAKKKAKASKSKNRK